MTDSSAITSHIERAKTALSNISGDDIDNHVVALLVNSVWSLMQAVDAMHSEHERNRQELITGSADLYHEPR